MKGTFKRCRKCGRQIAIIKERTYRNIIVEAEAVAVTPDPLGDIYIRIDGTKLRGLELPIGTAAGQQKTEYAYRPHNCNAV